MESFDTIIVGGGAAGLLAGGFAAQSGQSTLIIEKMPRPARKILVTGKGRCNLTNNCDQETFLNMVKTNPKFMYSSYSGFTAQDTMELFESLGVPLETQRANRVYPKSEKAMDIADAMVKFVKKSGAKIVHETVVNITQEDGRVKSVFTESKNEYSAKKVIIATGGKSYPTTGSTGDGYIFAERLGHTIVPLRSSLVAIHTHEKWVADAMGLSLKNVRLDLFQTGKKKPIYSQQGEMLFTHYGVSGPLVLTASAYMKEAAEKYRLAIDLKPALNYDQLDIRILKDFDEYANKDYANALGKLLPRTLIPVIIKNSGIGDHMKVNQITKEQRLDIAKAIKELALTPTALQDIEQAVVTAGGVSVKEIDPKTMESKLVDGLYFAGEIIDVDAFTGGFNLQVAFSTAHSAGIA